MKKKKSNTVKKVREKRVSRLRVKPPVRKPKAEQGGRSNAPDVRPEMDMAPGQAAAPAISGQPVSVPPPAVDTSANQLPFSYNETKLVLLVRDPYWAFCYWDFSSETWNWIQELVRLDPGTRCVLRVQNLDSRTGADTDVELKARNWHVHLGASNALFEAEIGLVDRDGKFHLIARSNRMRTPRDKPSDTVDHTWEQPGFEEIYRLSGGGKTGEGSEGFSRIKKF